jgi:PAS domain S-box-containing protein
MTEPDDDPLRAALRRSELATKNVQRLAYLGTWAWHLETMRVAWSEEMFRIFGVAPTTFTGDLGKLIAESIHPDDRAAVERVNRSVIDDGLPEPTEYRVLWPDGTIHVVRAEARELVRDDAGRPTILTGIAQDITDRKRADEALRASEEKFSKVFALAPVAMAVSHLADGTLVEVNDAFVVMFGHSREECVGATTIGLRMWAVEDERRAFVEDLRASGAIAGRECRLLTKRRTPIAGLISVQILEVAGVPCILSSITDITTRKRMEGALRESEARLATTLESMTDAVFVTDAAGNFMDFNDAFASFHRFESKTSCLRSLTQYPDILEVRFANGNPAPLENWAVSRALRGETATSEVYLLRRKDTGESWVGSYSFGPIRDEAGAIVGAVVAARDVTDRARAEAEKAALAGQLQQAQKMESVGRLAGGVAHDFNNMLGVILGHTEIAMEHVAPSQPLYEDLVEIRKAAQRSAELTRQLLAFARKQVIVPQVVDLNESVGSMLTMLRRLIGENVRLEWSAGAELWRTLIDPSQLDQILTNLCANARAAIADVGTLWIETDNRTFDAEHCAAHADSLPGEYVRLLFRDDGCGMDKETLAKVFEPFFTTRPVGEGTGLGLATVYGIVRQNEGFIDVVSQPGAGTTFSIYLPRHVPAAGAAPSDAVGSVPAARFHETILLVEDEESVLRVTKRMLELSGYEVIAANGPAKAIRLAREHKGRIHLVVTDVVMPEMNGHDLSKVLLSADPQLKRLFMSGYATGVIAQGVLQEGEHFIQKPFTLKALTAKVRETLES